MCVCVCVCACVCACACLCVYVHGACVCMCEGGRACVHTYVYDFFRNDRMFEWQYISSRHNLSRSQHSAVLNSLLSQNLARAVE